MGRTVTYFVRLNDLSLANKLMKELFEHGFKVEMGPGGVQIVAEGNYLTKLFFTLFNYRDNIIFIEVLNVLFNF